MSGIHPSAVVHEDARLGEGVEVGAFAVIGPHVVLGDRCRIGPHSVFDGHVEIGEGCELTSHVAIGGPPQDLKYAGEPTRVRIGARNLFREFCTINRGTAGGGGVTVIGDDNLFMTGSHVAHDCHVGSRTVFANNATLGGHVSVGDHSTVGAFTAAHQFCRIGRHAFLGGFTVVTQDVLPFMRTVGTRGDVKCFGPNRIGLQRKGFGPEVIEALGRAFRILRSPGGRTPDGLVRVLEEQGHVDEVREVVEFVEAARLGRGFHL
jgi:UDP-N-acetylglucosamine acyltransferase